MKPYHGEYTDLYTDREGNTRVAFEAYVNPLLTFTVFDGDQVKVPHPGSPHGKTFYVFCFESRLYLEDGRDLDSVRVSMRVQSSTVKECSIRARARTSTEEKMLPILRLRKLTALATL